MRIFRRGMKRTRKNKKSGSMNKGEKYPECRRLKKITIRGHRGRGGRRRAARRWYWRTVKDRIQGRAEREGDVLQLVGSGGRRGCGYRGHRRSASPECCWSWSDWNIKSEGERYLVHGNEDEAERGRRREKGLRNRMLEWSSFDPHKY